MASLFNPEARFMAADLGKRRTYASIKAQSTLGRALRSLDEAVVIAGESLLHYGLVWARARRTTRLAAYAEIEERKSLLT